MGALKSATYVDLSENNIGDEGAKALGSALASGALKNVLSVNLARNQIGDAGCTALAEACASGALPALEYAPGLVGNPASDAAKQAVEDAFASRSK